MLTWARACFEQGSLPSLLALPGEASLLVLPGDGMFHQWQMSTGDTTWLPRCQKGDAYQSRGSGKIWMGPNGSGNGWICVISSVVDWP